MRGTAVWIMLGVLTGAALSLATVADETVLRALAQSLPPAKRESNCTALVLDRVTGLTVATSCRDKEAILLEAAARERVSVIPPAHAG